MYCSAGISLLFYLLMFVLDKCEKSLIIADDEIKSVNQTKKKSNMN